MPVQSERINLRQEITIDSIALRVSQTPEIDRSPTRDQYVTDSSETEAGRFARIGETTSSPNIRRTGTTIGTITMTTFSTVIDSPSSTDSGGASTSGGIR